VLKGCQVKSYNGVDLSEPALALAVKNLGVLSCPVELVRNDIPHCQWKPTSTMSSTAVLLSIICLWKERPSFSAARQGA
jgi:hypothetical protein